MLTSCFAACAHLTITVSEIERDIGENNGRKAGFFSYPPLHSTPLLGGFPSEYRHPFGTEKLEWCRYPMVKKIRRYVYSFWRDPQTCRTDGRTDKTLHDSKDRAYASHRAVKTAKIKMFINYKCEIHALAHFNLSTASFKCLNAFDVLCAQLTRDLLAIAK